MILKRYKDLVLSKIHTALFAFKKNITLNKRVSVYYKSDIYAPKGNVLIGENSKIGCGKLGYHSGMPFYTALLVDVENAIIRIGDNCRINGAYIHSQSSVIIGNNCVIASGVNIIDSNGHKLYSSDRTHGRDDAKPIVIKDNVWIGINAIILKGTVVGNNCVISAGSVVKGSFPDNSLIQGNPARLVKILDIQ